MVVPDSAGVVPQPGSGSPTGLMEGSNPRCQEEVEGTQDLAGVELEEVRKLQELVHRLEVQNETLRNRGSKKATIHRGASSNSNLTANINERLTCEGVSNSHLTLEHGGNQGSTDFELSPPQDSSSSEEMSPLPVTNRLEEGDEEEEEVDDEERGPCGGFLTLTYSNGGGRCGEQSQTPESPSQGSYESETLAESDSGVDQSALDEVDVLDLEDECAEVEDEDSWYVLLSALPVPVLQLNFDSLLFSAYTSLNDGAITCNIHNMSQCILVIFRGSWFLTTLSTGTSHSKHVCCLCIGRGAPQPDESLMQFLVILTVEFKVCYSPTGQ